MMLVSYVKDLFIALSANYKTNDIVADDSMIMEHAIDLIKQAKKGVKE